MSEHPKDPPAGEPPALPVDHTVPAPEPGAVDDASAGQPYGAGPSVESQHVKAQSDRHDLAPSRRGGPLGLFKRLYGRGPFHLIGHLIVIAITAWVLSIIFQAKYAPRPLNLALWLLGGAVLHDGVFLPAWGLVNALITRVLGASDERPVKELAMGVAAPSVDHAGPSPAGPPVAPTSRDQARLVPVVNHVRVPIVISAVLFMVFLPRILNRQPQNFVNALGHQPPDFFMRWVWVTVAVIAGSMLLYAVRRVRVGGARRAPANDAPAAS